MSAVKAAMILAAGRGERMRPQTDTCPKPLAELAGKPLIEYHIERLRDAGIERIVINTAWLGKQIHDRLGDGRRFGVSIMFSDEGDHVLETGGGIFRALSMLGSDPFWVVSADLWTDFAFANARGQLAITDLAHLIMVENPDFHPRGDFCLENGRITENVGRKLTYASLAVLCPELFAGCKPGVFSIVPLLQAAMRAGRVSGECFNGKWHNIGTLQQLLAVERAMQNVHVDP